LLVDHNKHNYPLSLSLINEVLNHIVINACPLGYTNETAWSLWGLIHWNLKIDLEAATVISKTSDTVIALLALDAQRRGLIPNGLDLTLWESFMTTDDLYGKQWLLSYEANKKGWLPSYGTSADHVMAESNFNFLKSNDVSFYNEKKFTSAKTLRAFPSALLRMINVSP
jgi:hypothetical protein